MMLQDDDDNNDDDDDDNDDDDDDDEDDDGDDSLIKAKIPHMVHACIREQAVNSGRHTAKRNFQLLIRTCDQYSTQASPCHSSVDR